VHSVFLFETFTFFELLDDIARHRDSFLIGALIISATCAAVSAVADRAPGGRWSPYS